jgi:uncharacterized OB-fold protein
MVNIKYYVCKCTECGTVYKPYLVRCPNCNSYSAIKLPAHSQGTGLPNKGQ